MTKPARNYMDKLNAARLRVRVCMSCYTNVSSSGTEGDTMARTTKTETRKSIIEEARDRIRKAKEIDLCNASIEYMEAVADELCSREKYIGGIDEHIEEIDFTRASVDRAIERIERIAGPLAKI